MTVYDISQELLSGSVYRGDPAPTLRELADIEKDGVRLSELTACVHNGTHIDAPAHYIHDGDTIDKLDCTVFCGICEVLEFSGEITGADISMRIRPDTARLLIKGSGKAWLTPYAATELTGMGIRLVGVDNATLGRDEYDCDVHKILLASGAVILEGLVLDKVREGKYFLNAAPINISGAEGSLCRAVLFKDYLLI